METVYCGYSLSLKTRNPDSAGLPVAAFHISVKWHHLLVFVDQLGVPIDLQDITLSQTSQLLEMPLCILSWQSLCETHLERVLDALGVHSSFWADIIGVIMRGAFWGLGDDHRQFDMNINLELATKEEFEIEAEDVEEVSIGGYESDSDQVTRGVSKSTIEELKKKNYSVQDDDRCCCICLDELSGVDKVIEIPCLHLFHSKCIVKWLKRNDSCPLCRSKVEVEGPK